MAENLPVNFTIPSEGAVASYSYLDVANGLGYVSFYAMGTIYNNSGTNTYEYILSDQVRISDAKYVSGDNGSIINFDASPFNVPKTIQGVALVEYNLALNKVYAGSAWAYAKFEIVKVSGVTETSLGYVLGYYASSGDSNWTAQGQHISKMSLTSTNFKIGDILRLKITITGRTEGAEDDLAIFCDPTDSAKTSPAAISTSRLKLDIPFKIQL